MISGRNRGERGSTAAPGCPSPRHPGLGGGSRGHSREWGRSAGAKLVPARVLRISQRAAGSGAAPRFPGGLLGLRREPGILTGVGWWRRGSVRAPLPPPRSLFPPRWRALTWPRRREPRGSTRAGSRRGALTWRAGVRLPGLGTRREPEVGARRRREAAGEVRWCEGRRRGLREPGALPGQDSAQGPW